MLNAFDLLDKDGDGFIEESELAEILGLNSEAGHKVF